MNCDYFQYFFRDKAIVEDKKFTVVDGLGYMAIHRATLMSKGKVVEDANFFNYISYVNAIVKLPSTYRDRVLLNNVLLTGDGWPSRFPQILDTPLAGARRGALNKGKIFELLVPVPLSALTTTRLLPTAAQLSLHFQLEGHSFFSAYTTVQLKYFQIQNF